MIGSRRLLQCIIEIRDGSFASSPNKFVFPKPVKAFEINSPPSHSCFWAITGPQKTEFLKIISGLYIPVPPLSRVYPSLSGSFKQQEIQFLNFSESSGLDKVHLSARYESLSFKGELEMSDDVNSVRNYILGANNFNKNVDNPIPEGYVDKLITFFDLEHLQDKWINSLSNGQLRRARIVKSLVDKPKLLIIDDAFLGLDPEATDKVSESLGKVALEFNISLALGLRVQDVEPNWITNIAYVDSNNGLKVAADIKSAEGKELSSHARAVSQPAKLVPISIQELLKIVTEKSDSPHIQFENASVVYKGTPVLQNFNWVVPRGSRWRVLGNNGTGKTTILSLITADHPQSWKSVVSIGGVLRKSGSGSNFFDINNKVGITSPELHALVPKMKTMKQIVMTGLTKDVGNSNFMFSAKDDKLTDFAKVLLSIFQDRIEKFGDTPFKDLLITDQKLTLFLRATLKKPEILILDEAFSCMDNEDVMARCHDLVASWKDMTVLAIGHIDWELPQCDYVLKLRGSGKPYDIERYI